jgi:hypothetical protein
MLKMKDDPTMCMKTKEAITKCPAENTALCKILKHLHNN